jgi:cell division protein FtsL
MSPKTAPKKCIASSTKSKPKEERPMKPVKKKNPLWRHKFLILFVIAFSVYFVFVMIHQEIKLKELKVEEIRLNQEIERLTDEKTRLEQDLKSFQSLENIEKIARAKLKMVMPNEIIYVIQEQ